MLKGLLEDGEILLGDGRRFVARDAYTWAGVPDHKLPDDVHRIAAGFSVIALANRPGFPFLGNDFFSEVGDKCACA